MKNILDRLEKEHVLAKEDFVRLIENRTPEVSDELFERARRLRHKYYSNTIFVRGLIEFTNYCKNDCYYCGIRAGNKNAERYRLQKDDILECCKMGYELGYRTFVLQGGEDPFYTDDLMCDIVHAIRVQHPDCAITLSLGERSFDSYKRLKDAGANRYLLRHETASKEHYAKLHPNSMRLENRIECLMNLKQLGFTVGTGFMVGSPFQKAEYLADDLLFISKLQPQMVGIGPFISHKDTPFHDYDSGSVELTIFLIAILRLMLPKALLPATTSLGTADPTGREKGILAGGNVVMPNLSPVDVRKKYMLYDNKICTGDEAAECRQCLGYKMESIGYKLVVDIGNPASAGNVR